MKKSASERIRELPLSHRPFKRAHVYKTLEEAIEDCDGDIQLAQARMRMQDAKRKVQDGIRKDNAKNEVA